MEKKNRNKKLKIVVIAGGGVYGIIPCNFLRTLCPKNLDKVDVIGGTSVGGILSLHLAAYCDTVKLYDDFKNNVSNFFVRKLDNYINPFSAKYNAESLEKSLKKILTSKVSDCQKRFVVPSFSLKSVSPVIFHNFDE
jgi:patatin-like phospholipase/acyl hydrolase